MLFSTSPKKKDDALRLGADEVVMSNDPNAMQAHTASFDVILDTVSAEHDLNAYVNLLKLDATHVLLRFPAPYEAPFHRRLWHRRH